MNAERVVRYRAGPGALRLIRTEGFHPSHLRAFSAPASGPKWLTLAGIDRALMASGLLRAVEPSVDHRLLLVGASAGGWRVMAMACADAERAHAELEELYVGQVFAPRVTPAEVSDIYRRMLGSLFTESRVQQILSAEEIDVAVHVVRARGPWGSRVRWLQAAAMVTAAAMNAGSSRSQHVIFDRLLFHTAPQRWRPRFNGRVVQLDEHNLRQVALATGTVPLYLQPVEHIPGVAGGRHVDGGMVDYHLAQSYSSGAPGLVLFPHFQERIVPMWFDRYLPWRRPAGEVIDRVLQVFPSRSFLERLPDGRIPTRQDFIDFADDPRTRIERWQQVSRESDRLGEQLLDDLEHQRIPDLVEPMK